MYKHPAKLKMFNMKNYRSSCLHKASVYSIIETYGTMNRGKYYTP